MIYEYKIPQSLLSRKMSITLILIVAGLGLASWLCYDFIDTRLLPVFIKYFSKLHFNEYWNAFRQLGKAWVLIWLLLFWLSIRNWSLPVIAGLLSLLLLVPTIIPLKVIISRQRPIGIVMMLENSTDQSAEYVQKASFPSGDTATVFTVAVALMLFVPAPLSFLFFAVATGIGLLRIISFAHYPSDVFAGAAIGIFTGWLALKIVLFWWPRQELPQINLKVRIGLIAVLIAMVPLVGILGRMNPLIIFLKVFWPLLLVLCLFAKSREWLNWLTTHINMRDKTGSEL